MRSAAALAMLLFAAGGVLADIALTRGSDLGFGQVVSTTATGNVTVSPAGSRLASGGAVLGNPTGVGPATFQAAGTPNASYSITLPSTATLTGSSGSLTLDAFTSSPSGSGNLGAGGSQWVSVGATLHVGASIATGNYSGSYSVTVAYE